MRERNVSLVNLKFILFFEMIYIKIFFHLSWMPNFFFLFWIQIWYFQACLFKFFIIEKNIHVDTLITFTVVCYCYIRAAVFLFSFLFPIFFLHYLRENLLTWFPFEATYKAWVLFKKLSQMKVYIYRLDPFQDTTVLLSLKMTKK